MKYIFLLIFLCFPFMVSANSILKVAATAVPHAEILEQVKSDLSKQGIELKIIIFQDYVLPNIALDKGDVDVNFSVTKENFREQYRKGYYKSFVIAMPVHIESIGIYSQSYKNISEVKTGATVLIGNSIIDRGRSLQLLEAAGLIHVRKDVDNLSLDISDITSNPKKLKFLPFVEAAMLTRFYLNNEADLVLINANFALENNLNPKKDSIYLEGTNESPYVNVLITTKALIDEPRVRALMTALKSKKVHNFIMNKYKGAIVPVY